MSLTAYVPLAAVVVNIALTLFVLKAGVQTGTRIAYLIWGGSIAVWNFGTYEMFCVKTADEALAWARFLQIGVIFLPVSLFHLCLQVCGIARRNLIVGAYVAGLCLVGTVFTPYFVSGVRDAGYAWYSVGGAAFWVFTVLYAVLTFSTLRFLWRASPGAGKSRQAQIRSLLWATGILIAGGNNDILPILGIYQYPVLGTPIFPIGSMCAIIYGILAGYSVMQHQLLDVRFALGSSGAYVVRFLFLAVIAVLLNLIVATFAPPGQVTGFSFLSSIAVIVVSALFTSFLFPKLLGGTFEKLERKLMGDHFEYQDKVRVFIEESRWHTELRDLLGDLHTLLVNTFDLRGYSLILRDEQSRAFSLARSHPAGSDARIPELTNDSALFQFFLTAGRGFLTLGMGYVRGGKPLEAAAREQIQGMPGVLAFPFLVGQQPLGILVVDEKRSGRTFTHTDIQLLSELTTNVALVINQVSLKDQLLQAKELDLLGRMSQGMAHDLNNLTTPVWTLLQLLTEGVSPEMLRTDLAPVAIRNIQTMRDYIREALFFSENLRPDLQTGRLDILVQEVVEFARHNPRKGKEIEYSLRLAGDVLVEMDRVLIRRLISNLIANAVDASQPGGRIEVEISRLLKTDAERDWFRIRVTDHGSGIPSENLHRIFQPYFTTKKTGDEDRGFGLGLAICRKIASLHGGSLGVSSEVGKGTVVSLDLPNRHKILKVPHAPVLTDSEA